MGVRGDACPKQRVCNTGHTERIDVVAVYSERAPVRG